MTHDFRFCACGGCAVDGGMDYCRRSGSNYREANININDNWDLCRVSYGRIGSEGIYKRAYIAFKDMSTDWLDNVIKYELEYRPYNRLLPFYIREKQYRFENEIYVEEKV
jgi:hypothetical protein